MTKILITLDQEDWHDICTIMRHLTWGKNISGAWYNMKDRIEKRTFTEVKNEIRSGEN